MHHPLVKHTIDIFSRLADDLPPLVPPPVAKAIVQAREQMEHNYSLTIEELEDVMISFGKQVWAYREAFQEFLDIYEGKMGEQFLLGKLTPAMKKRYQEFKQYGGEFRDLHSGAPAAFFHEDERGQLCTALIEVRQDLRRYAQQAVLTTDQHKYEDRIVEFQVLLDDMEKRLDTLRTMADGEQEHPELAAEIRAEVRSFEYGLCLLGPRTEYLAVCNAAPHFVGRKQEKKLRGR